MQADNEKSESEYNILDDLSVPPEELWQMLAHEVSNCIGKIETSLYMLQLERITAETKQRSIESIGFYARHVRNIVDDTLTYVEKRKALDEPKDDAGST